MLARAQRMAAIRLVGACALFLTSFALGQEETPFDPVAEPVPGARPVDSATDAVPEGLSRGDWSGIRAAYEAERHAAHPVEGGYEARNPGQRWRTRFDGRGFLVEPDSRGWVWGLELERYGFAGTEQEATAPARVNAEGGRVAYAWDAMLEEWFANEIRGLEHGYTLHSRPPRDEQGAEGPLTFTLAVRGGLRAQVSAAGRGIRFLDEGGEVVLTYSRLSVFDADGRELEASFETPGDENGSLLLSIDERGSRYPLLIDPVVQQAYLKASNPGSSDMFGYSVAVSRDTVVVGAPGERSNATGVNGNQGANNAHDSGAVYVFVRTGTSWSQEAYLKASNTDAGDEFGWSVSISGETLVVGAYKEDSSATGVNGNQGDNSTGNSGAAYVFVRNGSTWTQEAYLKASNTGADDWFGGTVALVDDTLVIGARYEDSNATGVNGNQSDNSASDAGAAYVFARTGTSWSQEAYLKASNTDAGDNFGWSVALSDDTVVVGAAYEDSDATGLNGDQINNDALESGAAYVFVRSGTSWSQEAYLKASNTDEGDSFGWSVAVSGPKAVIGACREASNSVGVNGNQGDNSAVEAGAAYAFFRGSMGWSQEAYLKASNAEGGDHFGCSAALCDDTMVIGAISEASSGTGVNGHDNNNYYHAGAAYLFEHGGGSWSQKAYLKPSSINTNDWFGGSVAVSSGTVVVGMPLDDSNAAGVNGSAGNNSMVNAGSAWVFAPGPGTSYCLAVPNSSGAPAHISAGGSASISPNSFTLFADPVPMNQNGIFFYGSEQTQVLFGNGFLCVAPGALGIARLPIVQTGAIGLMTYHVDFTAPPTVATQITAGSTWNFQAWFRDTVPMSAFFNTSDGLEVTFVP